ncbi:MAG: glycosyltransferase family 92 protein [Selenomonadaceae bacterium]|nr:glycosyltransferase family 92 protein [Selenomonadaceae bacterium]
MPVDKNLFPYDLAIVSMMKNAAPYIEEWLEYHLLAGVNHFFIYDNESEDNFAEVLNPYVDAGLVTYIFYLGLRQQMAAFNEAIERYEFLCRYIAFVDDDEFIFPKSNRNIAEVTDEILSLVNNAGGLEICYHSYGSSGHKTADFNHGVLERFTHRAAKELRGVKSILNPRRADYMWTPHFAEYFDAFIRVNQQNFNATQGIDFNVADNIVMNHYHIKSLEEYVKRKSNTDACFGDAWINLEEKFNAIDAGCSEVFDDGILKYRDARRKIFLPEGNDVIKTFSAVNQINFERIFKALTYNLLPIDLGDNPTEFFANAENQIEFFHTAGEFYQTEPPEFFKGNFEIFFTCWGISNFLKGKYLDENLGRNFEKISLNAVCQTLRAGVSVGELKFLVREMPKLLALPYPVVDKIRKICMAMIVEWKDSLRDMIKDEVSLQLWKEILAWDSKLKLLQAFDNYVYKS